MAAQLLRPELQSQPNAPARGTVNMTTSGANVGKFTYTPNPGFTGTDSFTYTISNGVAGGNATSITGRVIISVGGPVIWYVDPNAATSGNGTLGSPFKTLAEAITAISTNTGQRIFLYTSATTQSGSFVLTNNAWLVGQAAVGTNFDTLMGISPTGDTTVARPSINNASKPSITNSAGDTITLGEGNTILGLAITNTGGAGKFAITGSSINAGTIGNATTSDVTLGSSGTSGGAFSLSGGNGNFSINAPITTTAGHSVNIASRTGGTINFPLAISDTGTGINLTTNTGATINFTGGLSLSTGVNAAFTTAGGGTVNVTGAGNTLTTTTGTALNFANTVGTLNFAGLTTTGGAGASITGNTSGSTFTFTGVSVSSGANNAFTATGGGTLTVTGAANTLTSTTGTALNISNTSISGSGITFRSISANGSANGIVLNNTSSGAFTVTGDNNGSTNNGSGGTISGTTAEGILINTAGAISLNYMNLQNSGTKGISVTGSTDVTINRCNVTDNLGGATDEGVNLINNTGTITLTNDVVDSAPHNQVNIDNFNTNLTAVNLTNSTFKCTAGNACQPAGSVGGNGVLVQIRGTSVLTSGNVQGCTMTGVRGTGIQVSTADTASIGSSSNGTITAPAASHSFVVQSNTLSNNNAGIDMDQSQHSNNTFQLLNNTLTFHKSESINAFSGAGAGFSGTITGYINGNQIGIQGTKDSGSNSNGAGIRMIVEGDTTQGFFTVDSNTIREVPNSDVIIAFSQRGIATSGAAASGHFKITNNNIPQPSGTNQSLGCGPSVPLRGG